MARESIQLFTKPEDKKERRWRYVYIVILDAVLLEHRLLVEVDTNCLTNGRSKSYDLDF